MSEHNAADYGRCLLTELLRATTAGEAEVAASNVGVHYGCSADAVIAALQNLAPGTIEQRAHALRAAVAK